MEALTAGDEDPETGASSAQYGDALSYPGKQCLPRAGRRDARDQQQPPDPGPDSFSSHTTLFVCQNLIIFVEKILRKFLRWQEGHLPDILL